MNVVCVALIHKQRLLLAQRPKGKDKAGLWEFVGGQVECNEDSFTAARRELFEELSLPLALSLDLKIWAKLEHEGKQFTFMAAQCPHFVIPTEHQALAWPPWEEIKLFALCPADALALKIQGESLQKLLKG